MSVAKLGTAYVDVEGDFSKLQSQAKTATGSTGKFGKSMGLLKTAAIGATAAVGVGLVAGLKSSIEAFQESEQIQAQTNAVLKSTKGAANVTAKAVGNLATQISKYSGVDDEAIQSGENFLLTFTNIRNEAGRGNDIFNQTTKTMADMSVALGQDMKSSALQLGKALNDPVKGVTALQRVGVSFTADQKEQIKTLVESGKTMDAQKLILAELNKEFGGSAKAAGDTTAGAMNKLKVSVGNLQESIGGALAPALGKGAQGLATFVQGLQDGTGAGGVFRDVIGTAFVAVRDTVGSVIGAVNGYLASHRELIQSVGQAIANVWNGVVAPAFDFALSVVQRALPGIEAMLRGFGQVVEGIVKVIAGVLTLNFGQAWDGIKTIFSGATTYIGGALRTATAPIRELADRLFGGLASAASDAVGDAVRFVGALPGKLLALVDNVAGAGKQVGQSVLSGLLDGLKVTGEIAKNFADSLWNAIKSTLNKAIKGINDAIPNSLGAGPFKINIKDDPIPYLAAGTDNFPGGLAVVGEKGPELINMPRGSVVHPADETRQMLGRGDVNVDLKVINAQGLDTAALARRLEYDLAWLMTTNRHGGSSWPAYR